MRTVDLPDEMTFETVMLYEQGLKDLVAAESIDFSFKSVQKVDSASLALMLSLIRSAREADHLVRFSSVPHALSSLITISGLESMVDYVTE